MKDSDPVLARMAALSPAERIATAAGFDEVCAVLVLHKLPAEERMVRSVRHLPWLPGRGSDGAFMTLQGVALERDAEAKRYLIGFDPSSVCGRLCVLDNQGPCACVVPAKVAELHRRQRALLWAIEAIRREPLTMAQDGANITP